MRPEGNPIDLNNLPEEYGKQALEESSTTTDASTDVTKFKKKKNGGKEDRGKVYECRFCSLKFCKSQALGGHMNRHRQERETETLNRARELVFNNEGLTGAGAHTMGLTDLSFSGGTQSIPSPSFQHRSDHGIGDPCLQFRPVYPRLPIQPPTPPPLHAYLHPSSSSHPLSYSAPYPPPSMSDYHVITGNSPNQPHNLNYTMDHNYACVGAPIAHSFPTGVRGSMARDRVPNNQSHGISWNCSYAHGQNLDPSSIHPLRDE